MQVPVTQPSVIERLWVALISMPTAMRPGPAWMADEIEPSDSPSTTWAPPCSRPTTWRLPSTGMRATEYAAESSRNSMPILRGQFAAAGRRGGR